MSEYLGPIMHYCSSNEVLPLTVLVVNETSGVPGEGLSAVKDLGCVLMDLAAETADLGRRRDEIADWLARQRRSGDGATGLGVRIP